MNELEEKVTITKKEFWELSDRYTQKELDERIAFTKKKVVKEYMKKVEELMAQDHFKQICFDGNTEVADVLDYMEEAFVELCGEECR